jgi:glycosyltransferase involved in cell wall biosynthesis
VTASSAVALQVPHISVCICTYKRPDLLRRLLGRLEEQRTHGLFTYGVVVSDNDRARSAEQTVAGYTLSGTLSVTYCVEPQQNIALARNRALAHAEGDYVAFIDDDELPTEEWLCGLFKTCLANRADGVLGPVNPIFERDPPVWITEGRFFDRPRHSTGYRLAWDETRTGNVLFRRDILNDVGAPFNSEFSAAGEDVDFFRRLIERGRTFVWCNEAVVNEVVPLRRCTRRYLLRRALLRGSNYGKIPRAERVRLAMISLIAVPCYTLALPVLPVFGQHVFIRYLIKLCDHTARLLSFVGVNLVTERQT